MNKIIASIGIYLLCCTFACQDAGKGANSKNIGQAKQPFRSEMGEQEKALLENIKKLLENNMLAETIEDANNFLAKYPNNVDAINYRGLAKARSNDVHGGIKDFDEAIRIDPSFVRSHYNKGLALYKLRDKVNARVCFNQAILIDPQDAKSYYSRGVLNFEELKRGEACNDWRKAKELGYEDKLDYLGKYCDDNGVPVTRPKK